MLFSSQGYHLLEDEKSLLRLERDEPIVPGQFLFLVAITRNALREAVAEDLARYDSLHADEVSDDPIRTHERETNLDQCFDDSPVERLVEMLEKFEMIVKAR
jgi:hypothetical protein